MDTLRGELAERLKAAGLSQRALVKQGFGTASARRLLNLDPGGLNLDSVVQAAALVGCTVRLHADGQPLIRLRDVAPTGSKPGKTTAMLSTDEIPGGPGALTRKHPRKSPRARP